MELFFREMGAGPEVLILHGLFGSSDNWQTFAKDVSQQGFRVLAADLRNHGQSPHDADFNYDAMADDVALLIKKQCSGRVYVIGHSMGGKTAMKLAEKYPELVSGLAVIDIAPRDYKPHHQSILAALRSFDPSSLASRGEADKILTEKITDFATRQFLLKNLYWKEKDKLAWRFNLEGIENNINHVGEATIPSKPVTVPALFIAGERSDYISETDKAVIKKHFPNAQIITAPAAGHWVHADNPQWLLETLLKQMTV